VLFLLHVRLAVIDPYQARAPVDYALCELKRQASAFAIVRDVFNPREDANGVREAQRWNGQERDLLDFLLRYPLLHSSAGMRVHGTAELCAAFLCAEFSLDGDLRHAGYIGHWIPCCAQIIARSSRRAIKRKPPLTTFAAWLSPSYRGVQIFQLLHSASVIVTPQQSPCTYQVRNDRGICSRLD
jgi:hypothetical protein